VFGFFRLVISVCSMLCRMLVIVRVGFVCFWDEGWCLVVVMDWGLYW